MNKSSGMSEVGAIGISVTSAVILSFFNLLTISVMLLTIKLRRRVSNFPVISFLLGSALQGMLPAPLYVYKILSHESGKEPGWLCDLYRFPYIFCVHIMELSIMVLGFDRLAAVKFPFRYTRIFSRRNALIFLGCGWLMTLAVDILPFFGSKHNYENCSYAPGQEWGLVVIIVYNISPFVTVLVNYGIVWKVAYNFAMTDQKRIESIKLSQNKKLLNENGKKEIERMKSSQKLRFSLEIKATKISLAIVAVFLVCWLPITIFYMADHFCHNCISNKSRLKTTRRAVKLLAFSSSLLAPLVYCWFNEEFRKAAKRLCRRIKGDQSGLLSPQNSSDDV